MFFTWVGARKSDVDKLDCERRPGPEEERIIESAGELKPMDPAQARQDRIEALKRLQKEVEASPTDRVIVEWDTTCLKDLPSRVAESTAAQDDGSVPVFDEYELHDSSERIVLKRGVYLRDRIGVKDKTDPEVRQTLRGREYALGIIASALGLQVWGPASGAPCEGQCRKALQSVMLAKDVPTLEAAHYSRLGVDVLHLKNLRKQKEDFVGDQAYPFVDDLGHGTSVTSVLAARHGNNAGGRGIMSTGKVMCLRVGGRDGIWLSDTIPALDYALRMGAKVSNHSYGGKGFDQAEFTAFRRASEADHLAVTAAGNSGCDVDSDDTCLFTPGAFDLEGILNVGANDVTGHRATFSNYGKNAVDVFAPGQSIFVGTNKMPNQVEKTCKYCYEFIDGTSFAAPMVSGMAAALWTHFEITQPVGWVQNTKKKSMRVKEAIMYSVTGSQGVAGAGRVNGVVNFYKALHYYDTVPPAYKAEFPDPNGGYQAQGSVSHKLSTSWSSSLGLLFVLLAPLAQHAWFLTSH
ncbi:putative subtilase family serine protease [Neospora caninum Liverpool]|uniref:subtilisin n=1 Tax=Neospora caninum (strain Liverpool) TaxID=572307 RepID=F0VQM0_NEOCL|nr:putative subtilase family serine protease [Neospora caninum Liverpool]CBZ56017.1 putative subtilase family serine protease [Neospora caninum Liverpool]|eukprot:XP_003886043.1 putative subtilase family serine protease [Neospora caninum Liverpool]